MNLSGDLGVLPPRSYGYCRRDDVFVGFGAAGVITPPPEHETDQAWLAGHCWVCKRSRDEILAVAR